MSKQDDGGTAFPFHIDHGDSGVAIEDFPGMSLRDWFAGQALNGGALSLAYDPEGEFPPTAQKFASLAYALADAMLAERAK
jgi:hypothetical protein